MKCWIYTSRYIYKK